MTCMMFSLSLSHIATDSPAATSRLHSSAASTGTWHPFALTYFCLLPLLFLDSFHKIYSDSDSPTAAVFIYLLYKDIACLHEASIFVVCIFPHLYFGRLTFDKKDETAITLSLRLKKDLPPR